MPVTIGIGVGTIIGALGIKVVHHFKLQSLNAFCPNNKEVIYVKRNFFDLKREAIAMTLKPCKYVFLGLNWDTTAEVLPDLW